VSFVNIATMFSQMMESFVSFTLADTINIIQQQQEREQIERLSSREYCMDLQRMRMDMVHTIREELRDFMSLRISSLDHMLVIESLMVSLGFKFVCEGTFPVSEEDGAIYNDTQSWALRIYAVLGALALIFPIAALLLTIYMRFEADKMSLICVDTVADFVWDALESVDLEDMVETRCRRPKRSVTFGDGAWYQDWYSRSTFMLCPHRRPATRQKSSARLQALVSEFTVMSKVAKKKIGLGTSQAELEIMRERQCDIKLVRKLSVVSDALVNKSGELTFFDKISRITLFLLGAGILFATLDCAVLMGVIYQRDFPSNPWVMMLYSGIVALGACGNIFMLVWIVVKFGPSAP